MKPVMLALALTLSSGVALAQTQTPTQTPGAPAGTGAGNPPTGWSGGATPRQSDTGKMHPDGKGPPASSPITTTAPPHAGDLKIASERDARSAIEAEGFTRVTTLKKDPDGAWSGRAMRGTSNVAVRVDARGNVSAE